MSVSSSTAVFFLSLLGIPISYVVNTASITNGQIGILVAGSFSLIVLCFLTYLAVRREGHVTDPLFYVFILGTFSSVIDLIIALENDGVIHGFVNQYLKYGEPYLKSAYGTMICYWDGIGHYAMYIMMLSALAWNQTFREVGLYWAGSIGHSLLVYLPGSVIGKFGIKLSFLLNIPYMVIPYASCGRFLSERPLETQPRIQIGIPRLSIWKRPMDMLLIFGLLISCIIAVFRGLTVLNVEYCPLAQIYVDKYEPYLTDPISYPKVQMLVYLFYFVPFYVLASYGLLWPGCEWMPDWAIIFAGAAMQAQVSHIGASLHHRTPYILRVPPDPQARLVFWGVNLLLLLLPQILALRCSQDSNFFSPSIAKIDTIRKKSMPKQE